MDVPESLLQIIVSRLHERALRIVYTDFQSPFEEFFFKGKFFSFTQIHKDLHDISANMWCVARFGTICTI